MWKDYPNAKYWIETISNPAHMHIEDNKIIFIDGDYYKAIESLTYILGQELHRDFGQQRTGMIAFSCVLTFY